MQHFTLPTFSQQQELLCLYPWVHTCHSKMFCLHPKSFLLPLPILWMWNCNWLGLHRNPFCILLFLTYTPASLLVTLIQIATTEYLTCCWLSCSIWHRVLFSYIVRYSSFILSHTQAHTHTHTHTHAHTYFFHLFIHWTNSP
jgi:hypothetical protein